MTRFGWGATLWILSTLTLPAQLLVAAVWPRPYSWSANYISDLGVTACGTLDAGTVLERFVCSPAHPLFNGSLIYNGVMLSLGALLLWSTWAGRRAGRVAMLVLVAAGVAVVGVGLFPSDTNSAAHNASALAQAGLQWVAMGVLVFTLRGSTSARWARRVTSGCLIVSLVGFALFVDAIGGGASLALGVGLTERIAFDTLTLWSAVLGVILLVKGPAAFASAAASAPRAVNTRVR